MNVHAAKNKLLQNIIQNLLINSRNISIILMKNNGEFLKNK